MNVYYLGVRFTRETNLRLDQLHMENNLQKYKFPDLGYHSTIVYSRAPIVHITLELPKTPTNKIGRGTKWALSGENLVLRLESDWLRKRFQECMSFGATSDYETYSPHITMAEGVEAINLRELVLSPIEIFVSEIFYRECR